MLHRRLLLTIVFLSATILAACTAPARPQDAPATPTEGVATVAEGTPPTAPTATPVAEAQTATPLAEQAPTTQTDWTQVAGREGDLYVLGNPDAPLRLLDYSDFL